MAKKQERPREHPDQPQTGWLRENYVTVVVCVIIALFVTTYVAHPMTVPTPSMEPTILVGDRLIVDKLTLRAGFMGNGYIFPAHRIQRGDILVFRYPRDPEVLYVKRAIGLPGETLQVIDKDVYINGKKLDEPYKHHQDHSVYGGGAYGRDNFGPITLPDDAYFMMGDNRDNSADSRYWGYLDRNFILGKPLVVFWSYDDESDAYLRTAFPEILQVYLDRLIHFIPKTRWKRMGKVIE
ncbi:MAG: signal peptidase I [Acidobacteria bacterium]|nr:signal peptidase I [Acidobacteriota bacterium]